jgi:16S rRNA (uracil1498-N3)-methyltransferase
MRLTRIYTPGPLVSGKEIALAPSAANHVARVLRLKADDSIAVFDGNGREFRATIANIKSSRVVVRVTDSISTAIESPLSITLVQGISRGERMDWVVQKAVELGVHTIVPVITTRSVVKLDRGQAAKKREHWHNIAVSACEQCGRNRLPEIAMPIALPKFLDAPQGNGGNEDTPHFRLVLNPTASQSLITIDTGNAECPHFELLIGPEGGLDDNEIATANQAGFVSVKLGPRILRTETAAIATLAVLQAKWGDLG